MPRIIAGTAGGIRLDAPPGRGTRPTADRVKEALFSILTLRLAGARVLDLFAGSGQMALEAVSRGAREAVLIERDPGSLRCIRTNIRRSNLEGLRLLPGDVFRRLEELRAAGARFDLVLMDPPYRDAVTALERAAATLCAGMLEPDATVVLEHDAAEEAPSFVTDLKLVRNCKYGTSMLSFYKENP